MEEITVKKIYVGNLPYSISDAELRTAFEDFGTEERARVVIDKFSGRSKGFGFVTMPDNDEANKAIDALNESDMEGRNVRVNEARPREDRPPRRDRY